MDLKRIFDRCLSDIGGENNKDVRWYREERPKSVSRENFFEQSVWAIWVSGMKRKAAESFLNSAEEKGFDWDYATVGSWKKEQLSDFMEKLHGNPVPDRAYKKWKAAWVIAKRISGYSNEEDFCKSVLGGKFRSADLDGSDVRRLADLELPFIGERNAHFIVRNMGGETIKCDRWIEAFLEHYKMTQGDLENKLRQLQIPLGLFDIVFWAYCEKFIGKVSRFDKHFGQFFG